LRASQVMISTCQPPISGYTILLLSTIKAGMLSSSMLSSRCVGTRLPRNCTAAGPQEGLLLATTYWAAFTPTWCLLSPSLYLLSPSLRRVKAAAALGNCQPLSAFLGCSVCSLDLHHQNSRAPAARRGRLPPLYFPLHLLPSDTTRQRACDNLGRLRFGGGRRSVIAIRRCGFGSLQNIKTFGDSWHSRRYHAAACQVRGVPCRRSLFLTRKQAASNIFMARTAAHAVPRARPPPLPLWPVVTSILPWWLFCMYRRSTTFSHTMVALYDRRYPLTFGDSSPALTARNNGETEHRGTVGTGRWRTLAARTVTAAPSTSTCLLQLPFLPFVAAPQYLLYTDRRR